MGNKGNNGNMENKRNETPMIPRIQEHTPVCQCTMVRRHRSMIIKGQKVAPSFRSGLNRMAKIVLAGFSMAQPKTMTKRKSMAANQKQKYKHIKIVVTVKMKSNK